MALVGRRRFGTVETRLLVAPGRTQIGLAAVLLPQPLAPGVAGDGRIVGVLSLPRALIEPFARVMPAGVIAGHVLAKLFFQVPDEGGQRGGRIFAILGRGDRHALRLGPVLPDHNMVRILLLPPLGRFHADPRQQQDLGIHLDHVAADGVGGAVVGLFTGPRPRHGHGQADEIDARVASQCDLVLEHAGGHSELKKHGAGPIEGDAECPLRVGPHAKRRAIGSPLFERQVGMVIDMEIGPLAAGRFGELHLQHTAVAFVRPGNDVDLADGVAGVGRPMGPVAPEVCHAVVEGAKGNHLPSAPLFDHADVVEQDRSRLLPETQMHSGVARLGLDGFEVEQNLVLALVDCDFAPPGDAEKHPPADRPAVDVNERDVVLNAHADIEGRKRRRDENGAESEKQRGQLSCDVHGCRYLRRASRIRAYIVCHCKGIGGEFNGWGRVMGTLKAFHSKARRRAAHAGIRTATSTYTPTGFNKTTRPHPDAYAGTMELRLTGGLREVERSCAFFASILDGPSPGPTKPLHPYALSDRIAAARRGVLVHRYVSLRPCDCRRDAVRREKDDEAICRREE